MYRVNERAKASEFDFINSFDGFIPTRMRGNEHQTWMSMCKIFHDRYNFLISLTLRYKINQHFLLCAVCILNDKSMFLKLL